MEISDLELVKGLLSREPAALEGLMDIYGSSVLALVTRLLYAVGSKEDKEECVSDVFVAAWHKIAEYDPNKGSLKTWLLILAKYKALDYRRKMGSTPTMLTWSEGVSDLGDPPERIVLRKEQQEELRRQLDRLGEPDRTIFYKRYFFYESLESIAASLGLTRKAVESRLGRCRKWLKSKLEGEGGGMRS